MSKKKKWLVPFIILGAVILIFGVIAVIVKQVNAKTVGVVPVSDLMGDYSYFGQYNMEMISGTITTHVTQKVQLDNDSIVEEVFVKQGDRVKEGDKLMSYDTTLTALELEIQKLTRENNERKLKKAEERLTSLENGGPINDSDLEEDGGTPGTGDTLEDNEPGDEAKGGRNTEVSEGMIPAGAFSTTASGRYGGGFMAVSTAGLDNNMPVEETKEEGRRTGSEAGLEGDLESESQRTETPSTQPTETLEPQPTESPALTPTPTPGTAMGAYSILDYNSREYAGDGSPENPYRFLCSQKGEYIVIRGSFFNRMAGYDAAGENKIAEGPYWYRLEFHTDDTIADANAPDKSLEGYYVRKGPGKAMEENEERQLSVEGAIIPPNDVAVVTPTPTEPPIQEDPGFEDDWEDDWGDEEETPLSREEAIKSQKSTIESLKLEVKSNGIQISKLEKKLKKQEILATIDGVVKTVGDSLTGESDGDAFIVVDSDDGFYVKGAISELMLGKIEEGQTLTVQAYESGLNFQAEIKEISQFPAGSSDSYGYGNSNPNVSYYPFMASVLGDEEPKKGEYVEMTMNKAKEETDGITIDVAFVKTENGENFVYKEVDGKLKKQLVEMNKISDGYSEAAKITSGLTAEDKIAFPYAKSAKEGTKTKDSTVDQLYGYY